MLVAGILYERYGDVEAVRRVLARRCARQPAGLLIATAAKMAVPMFRSFGPRSLRSCWPRARCDRS